MVTDRYIGGGGNDQVGTIIQYFGSNPPKGFLSCDGSIYNIVDYSRLANHIEGEFGSKNFFGGDGTTTFAVPDLRGEFLRGTGTNGATEISGRNVGYHQDGTEIPRSTIYSSSSTSETGVIGANFSPDGSSNSEQNTDSYINGNHRVYGENSVTKVTHIKITPYRFTSRPTNTSVLFCIRW